MDEKSYQKLLNKIGVTEVSPIRKNFVDGHFTCVCKMGSKLVLVKNISKKNKNKLISFKKELEISKVLASAENSSQFKRIKVLRDGEDKDYYWIIRQYVEGDSLAGYTSTKVLTLFGYDLIKEKYLAKKYEIIRKIIKNIKSLREIKVSNSKGWSNRYEKDLENYDLSGIESWLNFSLKPAIKFYKDNRESFFEEKNICASIGDLLPANIIINKENEVFFSDMEWFSKDNYVMDISFLWLFLWRYPDLQKDILSNLIQSQPDETMFRASVIRQIIGWYQKILKIGKKEELEAYKDHIWTRYLESAQKSYKELINAK